MAKRDSSQDTKKPRRAKGEGSLFQMPDGTWIGRVIVGRNEKTGQPVKKEVSGKTKTATKKRMDEVRKIYEGNSFIDAEKITVGEWLNKWLKLYATPPNVEPTTHEWYERILSLYLLPNLGAIKLHKLQGFTIQRLLNDMAKPAASDGDGEENQAEVKPEVKPEAKPEVKSKKKGKKESKPRPGAKSARTVKAVYTVLSMALTMAVKQGILLRSPASSVTVPQVIPKEKRPLTVDEWNKLLTAAQSQPDIFCAIVLFWATGARRSEILALEWSDIDYIAGTITIDKSIKICNKEHGGITIGSTKTKSRRVLPLIPDAAAALKAHKREQAARQLAAGDKWEKTGHVFTTEAGKTVDPRYWSKQFKKIADAAGVDIGVHTLRHDMSSRLAAQNIPIKEAQYQLGHSTVTMLLDTYAHRMQGDSSIVTAAISNNSPAALKSSNS